MRTIKDFLTRKSIMEGELRKKAEEAEDAARAANWADRPGDANYYSGQANGYRVAILMLGNL